MSDKPVKVVDAEISSDGYLMVTLNTKTRAFAHTTKAVFTPEALLNLVQEYGEIPPASEVDKDYKGLPYVTEEAIFSEENEDEEEDPDSELDPGAEPGDSEKP